MELGLGWMVAVSASQGEEGRCSPKEEQTHTASECSPMFLYHFCNVLLESDLSLNELKQAIDGSPRARYIHKSGERFESDKIRKIHSWEFPNGQPWLSIAQHSSGYLLRFPELADFTLSADGRVIRGYPAADVSQETIRHLLLDQVLPLALSHQGKLVLHAAAVQIGDGAVAFAGESGRGKSTLSSFLGQRGATPITDDCLVLEEDEGRLSGYPSYPGVRLWESSLEALFPERPATTDVADYTEKKRLDVFSGQPGSLAGPVPIRRIFLLDTLKGQGDRSEVSISPLSGPEAFMALVSCAFKLDITDKQLLEREFDLFGRLATLPLFFRLTFPHDFSRLPEVRDAILAHLGDG